jgi:hypothetical protein
MKNQSTVVSRFGRLAAGLAAAFFLLPSSLCLAAPAISVVAIQPARTADLILLSHGFDDGLRQGMVCRVTRGCADIAEILLVELRPTCSAALILSLAPGQLIHAGDLAAIKILKT